MYSVVEIAVMETTSQKSCESSGQRWLAWTGEDLLEYYHDIEGGYQLAVPFIFLE